ncbi:MAG: adenylate kinase [Candidatus Cloacimonetes bacterium]|nr:adenylate kinase [Candidatus Cloacimonadota bacterium]
MVIGPEMKRIAVVGTSCSGKTTFAGRLSQILQIPHIELDRLYWGPNWTIRNDFKEKTLLHLEQENWIVDGNYQKMREFVFARATTVIWLNYPFPLVFTRALKRTISRIITGEIIFSGNRETIRTTFFSADSILWWVIKSYPRMKKTYSAIYSSDRISHLYMLELKHPKMAEKLLNKFKGY